MLERMRVPPELQTAIFADEGTGGRLIIRSGPRPVQMVRSDGTAKPLLSFQGFGADVIRFDAGKGVMNHTHPGAHILFTLKGTGIVEYEGKEHPLFPGLCYLIPGNTDHAIRASTELVLIAVGNDHKPAGSEERMTPASNDPNP